MFRGNAAHTGVSEAAFFPGQGGVRWRVQTGGPVRSSPAVTATRLFIGSGDGALYAIDRSSGRVVWKVDAGSPVHASPAVASGLVVAATMRGRIFAVDEQAGRVRWSMHTGAALPINPMRDPGWDFYVSSPTVVGETIVIGGQDGRVYALDLHTGKARWTAQTHARVRATPAVANGIVVVGSFDGRVYAFDLATGAARWTFHTAGDTIDQSQYTFDRRSVQSSAAIADGVAFVGSRDGGVYAIDLATGVGRWRVSHRGSWILGSPAAAAGRVYDGSSDGHFVQAVDVASGRELWRQSTDASVIASPLLVGDALIVATMLKRGGQGDLLALDAGTGAIRWRLQLGDQVLSSPVAADGELYVGTEAGTVLAIGQANVLVPRLAVYYDSTLANQSLVQHGRLVFEYFHDLGYEALDSVSLAPFLAARVSDGIPSAVVFAIDVLPRTVARVAADTVLFRRYLNEGGKVVWIGRPPGVVARDSTGQIVDGGPNDMEMLIGVPRMLGEYGTTAGYPTIRGRSWGIDRWMSGNFIMHPGSMIHPLAADDTGATTAWVRPFRADRPGSGFVQLWGQGADVQRLPMIRAAAEYGLLRVANNRWP
ncbi:MAG TPA: PQQ-binding-like beta-propeller repeat protein [Gemmatimonadaceae bacterium]|nr:PQQ-binding-like beta-propeller repeat protein [Gemmatimonadaceae bacterium]